jgi:hypothetical protein
MPEPVKLTADDRERMLEFVQRASGAVSGHSPTDKEQELLQELRKEVLAISPLRGDELAARIALLDDANSWAQHFSTVRMAVTSFLTSLSLGIMQFRWDNPQPIHLGSSLVLWLLLLILLYDLTKLEYEKLADQRLNKLLLGVPGNKPARRMWQDVPLLCFLGLTVIYLIAFCYWWPVTAATCTGR